MSAPAEMAAMDDLRALLPCPFCGAGKTQFAEQGRVWSGTKYSDPIAVGIRHWCEEVPGQPSRMIERIGRDRESAIAAWNTRAPAADALDRLAAVERDAERWNRLCDLWMLSTILTLTQDEDGGWSIEPTESVDSETFRTLTGDTPDAAIDSARAAMGDGNG